MTKSQNVKKSNGKGKIAFKSETQKVKEKIVTPPHPYQSFYGNTPVRRGSTRPDSEATNC